MRRLKWPRIHVRKATKIAAFALFLLATPAILFFLALVHIAGVLLEGTE